MAEQGGNSDNWLFTAVPVSLSFSKQAIDKEEDENVDWDLKILTKKCQRKRLKII